jgi:hypothetical protein
LRILIYFFPIAINILIGGMFFMFLFVLIFDALNLRSDLPRFGVYDSRGMMRGDG